MTNLKRLILASGKSYTQIEQECHISHCSLSRYANGHRDIPLKVAVRIARSIDCKVEEMADNVCEPGGIRHDQ